MNFEAKNDIIIVIERTENMLMSTNEKLIVNDNLSMCINENSRTLIFCSKKSKVPLGTLLYY